MKIKRVRKTDSEITVSAQDFTEDVWEQLLAFVIDDELVSDEDIANYNDIHLFIDITGVSFRSTD